MMKGRTFDGVDYWPGRKFRVLVDGTWLRGMVPEAPSAWRLWRQILKPGDIITCLGFGPDWGSDPGYGIQFESRQSEKVKAVYCTIYPYAGGLFDFRPVPGTLEPVKEET